MTQFPDFVEKIPQLQNIQLSGQKAQFAMAPALRKRYDNQKIKAKNPKVAAVLALFYPNKNNETTFLLTERAKYKGAHSAQISFPGGKTENQDDNLETTALRETREEVGVSKKNITIIREITDVYIPPSNFLATPFLGVANSKPTFQLNHEVESVLEIPLKHLLDDSNVDSIVMSTSYMDKIEVPCFNFNKHIVWGATGMILSEIKELIKQAL